jgi:subtilisin family serine protease
VAAALAGGLLAGPAAGVATAADPRCLTPPTPDPVVAEPSWVQPLYDAPGRLWPFSRGAGTTVAVLDTGVDRTHPQLGGRVLGGADPAAASPSGDYDCAGHGTALAGVVAGARLPEVGSYGLAPDARVLPVHLADQPSTAPSGTGVPPAVVAAGVDVAVAGGASVVLVGVVLYRDDPGLAAAVQRAVAAGVVVVAPVGDGHVADRDGDGPTTAELTPYPAAYPGVLGVGAVGQAGARSPFSQVGGYVDLVAPGEDVLAAGVGGQRGVEGTAVAAAVVAASAALVLAPADGPAALPPDRRVAAVADLLTATATPAAGSRDAFGAGLVDPHRALTEPRTDAAPASLPPYEPPPADPAAEARAAQQERTDSLALRLTLGAGGAALLGLAALRLLPRARRRGWRSGTARIRTGSTEPAPEFLPGEALFTRPGDDPARRV